MRDRLFRQLVLPALLMLAACASCKPDKPGEDPGPVGTPAGSAGGVWDQSNWDSGTWQ